MSHVEFVQWRKCSLNSDPTPFGISMVSYIVQFLREIVLNILLPRELYKSNIEPQKNRRDYLIVEYQSRQASNSELCSVMLTCL
jgi:hypothetical protein